MNVDRHFVTFENERKLQAMISGVEAVGAGVGIVEEVLAADVGRTTSPTTSTATAPTTPHAKIRRYNGRWYHFVTTYSALATLIVPFSGASCASTIYKPLSAATRVLPCEPVSAPVGLGAPSSCLESSVVDCRVESVDLGGDLNVRLVSPLRNDCTGNAAVATS
jgi:hypothetical protein